MEILYQDQDIVVINKQGGLLAVPGKGPEKQDCAATRLRSLFTGMINQPAVHRLDMYTAGLMVFAMSTEAHRHLSGQFQKRVVTKHYIALVEKIIEQDSGEIRLSFRLDPNNRPLQIYDPVQGKLGITNWQKMATTGNTTRIKFTPVTGRTHQLRVHAAHSLGLGGPIVGDSLYGSGKDGDQMMLHATYLRFLHPTTEDQVEFSSSPPF